MPPRAEELWPHQHAVTPGNAHGWQWRATPHPCTAPRRRAGLSAGRGDSLVLWFLPLGWAALLCWLMLKAACLSLIGSVEGLTLARLTASLPPWEEGH